MTAKCAGCSDEATEPIENEGTDAGTQVEVRATDPFATVQQEALTLLRVWCLFRPWQWHV